MSASRGGGITVADGFLPAALFAGALNEFQLHPRAQVTRSHPANDAEEQTHGGSSADARPALHDEEHVDSESVIRLTLPTGLQHQLQDFAARAGAGFDDILAAGKTDGASDPSATVGDEGRVGQPVELFGQVQRGDHHDHHDVTCSGGAVDGQVCAINL